MPPKKRWRRRFEKRKKEQEELEKQKEAEAVVDPVKDYYKDRRPTRSFERPPPPPAASAAKAWITGALFLFLPAIVWVAWPKKKPAAPQVPLPTRKQPGPAAKNPAPTRGPGPQIRAPEQSPRIQLPANNQRPVGPEQPAREAPKPMTRAGFDSLSQRSEIHAKLRSILDEYLDAYNNLPPGLTPDEVYKERLRLERDFLAKLRRLGDGAIPVIAEFIKGTNGHRFQLVLAKALAEIEGPLAKQAIRDLLVDAADNVRLMLVRSLPRENGSVRLLDESWDQLKDENLRVLALSEVNRWSAEDQTREEASKFLRDVARNDEFPRARAQALALLGRRGDREDVMLLRERVRVEQDPLVRQRAIMAFAKVGGAEAIETLRQVAGDRRGDAKMRVIAILGLQQVGPEAIPFLEEIARSDPAPQIQRRADLAARSLRARYGPR